MSSSTTTTKRPGIALALLGVLVAGVLMLGIGAWFAFGPHTSSSAVPTSPDTTTITRTAWPSNTVPATP